MRSPSHPLRQLGLRLIQQDFAAIPAAELGGATYDLVFAVAVFEHANNLQAAISKVAALLRAGGRAFVHLITSRVVIPRLLDPHRSPIGRYFPGGKVWPFDTIVQHTAPLDIEASWFINGLNYWRTLEEWHQAFWRNLPTSTQKPSTPRACGTGICTSPCARHVLRQATGGYWATALAPAQAGVRPQGLRKGAAGEDRH